MCNSLIKLQITFSEPFTFDRDTGRYRRLPLPVSTPGNVGLVADVVSRLTEEMDGALLVESSTWGRITAEASMFGHQRVRAVAQAACGRSVELLAPVAFLRCHSTFFRLYGSLFGDAAPQKSHCCPMEVFICPVV